MTLFDGHMPPPVDLHCHLAEAGGYKQIAAKALVVAVTNDPTAWRMLSRDAHDRVTWAIGLHPRVVRRDDTRAGDLIRAIPLAGAVGEIGLDYTTATAADKTTQRKVLHAILADLETQRRLVTIHSVSATTDVVSALGDRHVPGAVLHWFLGSSRDLERAIDHDAYFSINSAMLASRRGRMTAEQMPPNRVLAETDAPYTKRGKIPLAPGDVAHAESILARMWQIEPREVRHRLWENLSALQKRLPTKPFRNGPLRSE